jgi:hypothetical protein
MTNYAARRSPRTPARTSGEGARRRSGYVVGGVFEKEGDFIGFMRARRSAVDPSTIEMRDWPVDEHGRGLTLLELDARTKQERIA